MLTSLLALAYIRGNGLPLCHYLRANLSNEVNPKQPRVKTKTAFTNPSDGAMSCGLNELTTNIISRTKAPNKPMNRFELTASPSLNRFFIQFISVGFCES